MDHEKGLDSEQRNLTVLRKTRLDILKDVIRGADPSQLEAIMDAQDQINQEQDEIKRRRKQIEEEYEADRRQQKADVDAYIKPGMTMTEIVENIEDGKL